jgi:hypothetical protein
MRLFKAALATVGASALLVGALASPALADVKLPVYGGVNDVTTAASVVPYLSDRGIIMTATEQATSDYIVAEGTVRQEFLFPVTTPSALLLEDNVVTGNEGSVVGGKVKTLGAIKFTHTHNGQKAKLGGWIMNLNTMRVYATVVNGDPVSPMAVFRIVLVDPPLYPSYDRKTNPTAATLGGINLYLTSGAAKWLNSELIVKAFPTNGTMRFAFVSTYLDLMK